MNVMCSTIHVALPTVGESAITGPLAAHVGSCSSCWGEVARYQSMYSQLESLDPAAHRAPPDLLEAVTSNLGPVAVETAESRMDPRVPVAAAAVVATAAAGTAVLFKLYRDHAA